MLVAATLVFLAAGEAFLLSRSDGWRLFAARHFGLGDRARITQLIGLHVRRGLEAARVPSDSVREQEVTPGGVVRWRVGLAPEASVLQVNYAITEALLEGGGEVIAGHENAGSRGEDLITLKAGLPRRVTHEITLVRASPRPIGSTIPEARLALVLFGFSEDLANDRAFFDLPVPFAVAISPGAPSSRAAFHAARERDREVVLHLPLEPINFPQVNPGPGAILVTMKPDKISGLVRRYLDEAGPVSAVANHMGSLATQDMEVMRAVYQELKRRQVPFLHVDPAAGAVCKLLAADLGVAYDQPDVVIDAEARAGDTRALDKRWNETLAAARHRGQLMVMLRATPLTLAWLSSALTPKRLGDVSVVPLGSLLRKPAAL